MFFNKVLIIKLQIDRIVKDKNLYIISAELIKRGVGMKVLIVILTIMASILMGLFAFFLCWLGDKSDN